MKKLLSLGPQQFLSGINLAGAHGNPKDGIFFKAVGVTPLFEAGTALSTNNGLLMPGAAATTIGGTPNGNFICSAVVDFGTAPFAFFGSSTGHIFRQELTASGNPPSGANLSDQRTAPAAVQGLATLQPTGGTRKLYYFMLSAIGDYDGSTWDDTATFSSGGSTISTAYVRPVHKYFDSILYGNGLGKIGSLTDDGAAGVLNTLVALDIPTLSLPTAISDDSVYAVIAITDNIACDPGAFADTKILFWDGFSSSWLREHRISDPFILSIKKTPIGVFAFGMTGIWEVTFAGVKKVVSHPTGIYTTTGYSTLLYGQAAATFFSDAIAWGGTSGADYAIKALGSIDAAAPSSYLHPFKSTASKNITLVDGQILKGWVYVGDDTPLLKAYPFSTANSPQAGNSAQTIYFDLQEKHKIERVDVVFGEPLVSGDAFSVQLKTDEDASASPVTALTATFAADGAIRRKKIRVTDFTADQMLSLILNYTTGAVKMKRIDIYGSPNPEL